MTIASRSTGSGYAERSIRPKISTAEIWSEPFLLLYLEEVDERIFAEPAAAIEMAEISPLLARWIPVEECSGGWLRSRVETRM